MATTAKPVKANIKFRIQGGKATPAPPVGSMLGAHGVNMMDFINAFNDQTKELGDQLLSVRVQIYEDRTFIFRRALMAFAILEFSYFTSARLEAPFALLP